MDKDMNDKNGYEIKISDDYDEPRNDQGGQAQQAQKEVTGEIGDRGPAENRGPQVAPENNYLERLQRLQAEFANYKRRVEKEKLELSDLFKSQLVSSLLPVIDDFERMLDHTDHDEDNEFLKGVKLIYKKLIDVLKEQGLKPIEAVGARFDPGLHEAVLIENGEDGEDEIVTEEWRKGYLFNNRLLRPAQVKVLKTKAGDEK